MIQNLLDVRYYKEKYGTIARVASGLKKIIFKGDMLIAHLHADVNNSMKLITLMSKKTVANGKTLKE